MISPNRARTLNDLMDELAGRMARDAWTEPAALEQLDQVIADLGSAVEVFSDYADLLDLDLSRRGEAALRRLMGLPGARS
jgi:acetoacetate decarboxylase